MITSPCKDCEKCGCGRYHDDCVAYQDYLSVKEIAKERKLKADKLDRAFDERKQATKRMAKQHSRRR